MFDEIYHNPYFFVSKKFDGYLDYHLSKFLFLGNYKTSVKWYKRDLLHVE